MEPFHSKTGNKLIAIAIAVLWLVVLYLVLAVTRIDPEQQMAQKIFYYHVPSAWTRKRRARNAFLRPCPDYRSNLGKAHLGSALELGAAAHHRTDNVPDLYWVFSHPPVR